MFKKLNIIFITISLTSCMSDTGSEDSAVSEMVNVSTTLQIVESKINHDEKESHNHDDDSFKNDVNNNNTQEENQEKPYDANVVLPNASPDKLEVLNFQLNEKIYINFSSDLEREIHVHGYDIHFMVYPDKENVLELELTIAGEFEIEEHDKGFEFARLVVSP